MKEIHCQHSVLGLAVDLLGSYINSHILPFLKILSDFAEAILVLSTLHGATVTLPPSRGYTSVLTGLNSCLLPSRKKGRFSSIHQQ